MIAIRRSSRSADLYDKVHLKGHRTNGVIFDRWTTTNDDGDTTYYIAYAFQTDDARIITRAEYSRYEQYIRYYEGDVVPVRYLPANPRIAMIDDG